MAGDAIELHGEHPDVLGASRNLDVHQLLKRGDGGRLAEEGGDVLERVGVADRLVVISVLAELLNAAVQVSEHRIEINDLFAVHLDDDAEHTVCGRVLRSHVDEHLAVPKVEELRLALCLRSWRGFVPLRGGRNRDSWIVERWLRQWCCHGYAPGLLRSVVPRVASTGVPTRSMFRTPAAGERDASSAR